MIVKDLINVLEKLDQSLPVVIKNDHINTIDGFIDLIPTEVSVIKAQKISCPVVEKSVYDASIGADVNTKAVSLNGRPITGSRR